MQIRWRWRQLAIAVLLLVCTARVVEACEARSTAAVFEYPRCSKDIPVTPLGDMTSHSSLLIQDSIDAHTGPLLYSFIVPDSDGPAIEFSATTCNPATTFDTVLELWPGEATVPPPSARFPLLGLDSSEDPNVAGDDDARCASSPLASTLERKLAPGPYTLSVASSHAYIGAVPGSFHLTLRGRPHDADPQFRQTALKKSEGASLGSFTISLELCPTSHPDADSASGSPVLAVAWSSSRGLLGVAAAWLGGLVGHSARFVVSAAKAHPTRADVLLLVGRLADDHVGGSLAALAAGLHLSPPVPRFGGIGRLRILEACYRGRSDRRPTCVEAVEVRHEDHYHPGPPRPAAAEARARPPSSGASAAPDPSPAPTRGRPSRKPELPLPFLPPFSLLVCVGSAASLVFLYRRTRPGTLPLHDTGRRVFKPLRANLGQRESHILPEQRRDSLSGVPPALITPRRTSLASAPSNNLDSPVPLTEPPLSFFSRLAHALSSVRTRNSPLPPPPPPESPPHERRLMRTDSGRWVQLARSSSGRFGKLVRSASGRLGGLPRSLSAGSSGVANAFAALSRVVSRRPSIADSAKLGPDDGSGSERGLDDELADLEPEPLEAVAEGDERESHSEMSSRRTSRRGSMASLSMHHVLNTLPHAHAASMPLAPTVTIESFGPSAPEGPPVRPSSSVSPNRRASVGSFGPPSPAYVTPSSSPIMCSFEAAPPSPVMGALAPPPVQGRVSRSATMLYPGAPRVDTSPSDRVSPVGMSSLPPARSRSFSFDARSMAP